MLYNNCVCFDIMTFLLQYGHCYSTTYANSYSNRKPPAMDELRYGHKGIVLRHMCNIIMQVVNHTMGFVVSILKYDFIKTQLALVNAYGFIYNPAGYIMCFFYVHRSKGK